jgi:hypothetical protein
VSIIADPMCSDRMNVLPRSERGRARAVPSLTCLASPTGERKESKMKRYEPQSPDANEPGDHPPMGERKGNWKVLIISTTLAVVGLFAAGAWFGAFG